MQVSREIEIHGSLLHPNIIKLYAAFEDGDGIYLVQELAAKGDLYLELSRHGGYMLEAHVVKHVMQPFLAAMTYLHSLGILHRDIKPENVLLGPDGEIKLADFGLAINTSKEKPMSRVGTLDYMPPEVSIIPCFIVLTRAATYLCVCIECRLRRCPGQAALSLWPPYPLHLQMVATMAFLQMCGARESWRMSSWWEDLLLRQIPSKLLLSPKLQKALSFIIFRRVFEVNP